MGVGAGVGDGLTVTSTVVSVVVESTTMIVDVPAAFDVNTNGSPAAGTICGCTLPPVVTFSSYGGTPPVITNRNVLP